MTLIDSNNSMKLGHIYNSKARQLSTSSTTVYLKPFPAWWLHFNITGNWYHFQINNNIKNCSNENTKQCNNGSYGLSIWKWNISYKTADYIRL